MVRRAERGIGVAIRNGQEAGEIRSLGDNCRVDLIHDMNQISGKKQFFAGAARR